MERCQDTIEHGSRRGRGAHGRPRDEGAALLITMFVVGLVTVLTSVIVAVTVDDLSSSRRSRDAATALDASEAGIAQALAYLRTNGAGSVSCSRSTASPYFSSTCTSPWTDPAGTVTSLPGLAGQSYRAWIEPIAPLPASNPGRYRIHATGYVGDPASPAARREVELDVFLGTGEVGLPLGLFGRAIEGGGDYTLARASIFSTGCVYNRARIEFESSLDAAYGIPTGVHAAATITESNGNNPNCAGTNKPIHQDGRCGPQASGNLKDYPFRFDQDPFGGSLLGTPCASVQTTYPKYYAPRDLDGDGSIDVEGSWIRDSASLQRLFGIKEEPFTAEQLAELREVARTQFSAGRSHFFDRASGIPVPDPVENPHSVLFIDLLGTPDEGKIVDLKELGDAWEREDPDAVLAADDPTCVSQSLLIVIVGGNARLNSAHRMAASLVLASRAPYGKVLKHNGSAEMIGTVFADFVDLAGTGELSLDGCFIRNLSPALLAIETDRYREVDR